ncbi:hypothetical protein, partial [Chryseobacterium sp. VD8]|uniref:hypothetical protein n=1 Tax=Chryseobacterium sp. VD8 TaxID=3081254 RepID=UPI0030186192
RLGINDIKNYLEDTGIICKWTLTAEARQYRETLKLEEEMKTNKQLEKEWEQYQEEADPVALEEVLEGGIKNKTTTRELWFFNESIYY